MSEPCLLSEVSTGHGYDYTHVFSQLKGLLEESDYVIGNLETPVAGESFGYSDSLFSFNSPESILVALKDIGINMLSTANNHTMDKGYEGLSATIDNLDKYGISHSGTYKTDYKGDRTHYFQINNTTFAVIAYTYSSNYRLHHKYLDHQHENCINFLMPYDSPGIAKPAPKEFTDVKLLFSQLLGRELTREESTRLKVAMKIPVAYADDVFDKEAVDRCLKKVERDCIEAKSKADLVFFYPHMGGQFNVEVGELSSYIMNCCSKMGFDAIISNHPHTIQKAEYLNNIPCFYSLGNVSQSPISVYAVRETLPEYGLVCHLYISDNTIIRVSFSFFKILEGENLPMTVIPITTLVKQLSDEGKKILENDLSNLYLRITGNELTGNIIREEYELDGS